MKKLCLLLLLLFSITAFSQEKYFNTEHVEISYKKFIELKTKHKYDLTVFTKKVDSVVNNELVKIYKKGTLKKKELKQIQDYMQADSSKVCTIIYLPKKYSKPNKPVSTWNIFDKDFRAFVNRKHTKRLDAELFWITALGNKDLKYFHNWKIPWQEDSIGFIKNIFFKEGVHYSAYIIINPNGTYVSYFGEFSKHRVLKDLAKLSKK
jgi:hypothetical protein